LEPSGIFSPGARASRKLEKMNVANVGIEVALMDKKMYKDLIIIAVLVFPVPSKLL
jgi:hypothetical protein